MAIVRNTSLLFALSLLAACSGGPKPGSPGSVAKLVDQRELPAPVVSDMQETRSYLIGPFDKLSVQVFGIEELSRETVQVGADGMLTYPLIGSVQAAGKSPAELESAIAQALRGRYLRDPQITVNMKETITQTVTVEGQVLQPGIYPVVGKMSLLRAVATAKGVGQDGNSRRVTVLRTVQGQQMVALYDLASIRNGVYADPDIYPNDVVSVGDSSARKYFRDLLTVVSTLSYPIVAIIQR